ncbi:MAG: helix-turn-helix domain-containing protein, partial [Pseudomonadota bacterium]
MKDHVISVDRTAFSANQAEISHGGIRSYLAPEEFKARLEHFEAAPEQEIIRGYEFSVTLTPQQLKMLKQAIACARRVWNGTLEIRRAAYAESGVHVNFKTLSKLMTEWRTTPETAWMNEVCRDVMTQTLRDQDRAYTNFFEKRGRRPKFKRYGETQSVRFQLNQTRIDRIYKSGELLVVPTIGT